MVPGMPAQAIRCQSDIDLFNTLKERREVKNINDKIKRHEAEGPSGIRRQLLATSVRLTRGMAKSFNHMADECIERLGVELPLELYVYSSPQFNAACFKPEDDRLFVMFSSSILEGFDAEELRFVMGHELGHHIYQHHDIPIGHLLNGREKPDPKLALELFAWSRYAEISADRAGAHCAKNMNTVARSLFKLSSGLTSKVIQFSLDDFVQQVDEMEIEGVDLAKGSARADWFSTHPFSPIRVKALKLFEQSTLYLPGSSTNLITRENLEAGVQDILSLMEPSYLEGKTDTAKTMRSLLFAGAIAVADASNGISEEEIKAFEAFFGKYSFSDKLDISRTKATLPKRMEETRVRASQTQCMQIVRDLCVIAEADGKVSRVERDVIENIATCLGISTAFVDQVFGVKVQLD